MRHRRHGTTLTSAFLLTVLMLSPVVQTTVFGQVGDAQSLSAAQTDEWRAQIRQTLFVPAPLPPLDVESHGRFEPAPGAVLYLWCP
jgi:hypothetical protein